MEGVYFPNIEDIFERHNNNKTKIIDEFYHFEEMFRQTFQELTSLKEKMVHLEQLPYIVEKQKEEVKLAKQKATHYENLYKSLILTSSFSHLRDFKNIQGDLLQFNSGKADHMTVEENKFNKIFSSVNQIADEDSIQNLTTMFPDLFKKD
ncbi:hypothetical protein MKX73_15540 [Solibacillus sp. FSL W7-1436]|uniref:hypothetical protein n=1 Tax=Solibacillus sp. FSL W7-1436 TaxID=2921705 RepID=UPI0030F66E3F